MAQKQRNEVAVGLTVLVVLALAIYIVVALSDWSNLFARKQRITVQLSYQVGLKGLTTGSPVHLGGVKIGHITRTRIGPPEVDLETAEPVCVFFTIEIPDAYPLRDDCVLSPQSTVLGGLATLAIKDLGAHGRLLKDGQTVSLKLEAGIADAMDAIKDELNPQIPGSLMSRLKYEIDREHADSLMASLAATAANLKDITDKIDRQITPDEEKQTLIAKLHTTVDHLGEITRRINEQFDAQEQQAVLAKVHSALDALNSSLGQIDQLIADNREAITETVTSLQLAARTIAPALEKAGAAVESAQAAMDNLRDLTAGAKETLLVNRESVDGIVRNMHEVSVNVKLASREIRRAPWKLLYTPGKDELHIQGVVDAAGAFAAGAERLDEATLRLRALAESAVGLLPLDTKRLDAVLAELETSFQQFRAAEEKFWKEIK